MTRARLTVAAGFMLVLVIGSLAAQGFVNAGKASDQAAQLHAAIAQVRHLAIVIERANKNSTANRVANVGTWCGAINQGRDYNRAFIAHVAHGHLTYTLHDLPCHWLEYKTAHSATTPTPHRH